MEKMKYLDEVLLQRHGHKPQTKAQNTDKAIFGREAKQDVRTSFPSYHDAVLRVEGCLHKRAEKDKAKRLLALRP